jgi:hypothetical protein
LKVIRTAKYGNHIVLLSKKELVLYVMTGGLIEVGRCCGMEMSVGKNSGNENLKTTIFGTDYDRSETTGKCGIFQQFG